MQCSRRFTEMPTLCEAWDTVWLLQSATVDAFLVLATINVSIFVPLLLNIGNIIYISLPISDLHQCIELPYNIAEN